MAPPSKYTPELRERAVRMVMESRADYPHETAAIKSVASKLGITTPESLRKWLRQAEIETLNWVDFFNNERPHESLDDLSRWLLRNSTTLQGTSSRRPAEPTKDPPDTSGRFTHVRREYRGRGRGWFVV